MNFGRQFSPKHLHAVGRGSEIRAGSLRRKRFSKHLCMLALKNANLPSVTQLPGVRLRPLNEETETTIHTDSSSNEIIDLKLQQDAYRLAHRQHREFAIKRKCTRHAPTLVMKKVSNRGFGITVRFSCSRCHFVSTPQNLFHTTPTGACVTNLQSGVAFSKTSLKPTEAELVFNSMGVSCPSRKTLQKHFTNSNSTCASILDESLAENRAALRDYVELSQSDNRVDCPSVAVSFDGQYNRPVYHGFDGKASSVSEPVLEEETGMNLLVGYAVVSKKDGSYEPDKVSELQICIESFRSTAVPTLAHMTIFTPLFSTSMVPNHWLSSVHTWTVATERTQFIGEFLYRIKIRHQLPP